MSSNLRTMYNNRRHNYVGAPFDNTYLVDAELVEQMIGITCTVVKLLA